MSDNVLDFEKAVRARERRAKYEDVSLLVARAVSVIMVCECFSTVFELLADRRIRCVRCKQVHLNWVEPN